MKRSVAKFTSAVLSMFAAVFTVTEKYPLGEKSIPPKTGKN
ncbi:MAG: hypothetical protein K0Q90_455 [Paenibacillaceae bacterium]|jgi:hypothetical protein|nr:hypothetical protein [Paenibacillaceae bacterium]